MPIKIVFKPTSAAKNTSKAGWVTIAWNHLMVLLLDLLTWTWPIRTEVLQRVRYGQISSEGGWAWWCMMNTVWFWYLPHEGVAEGCSFLHISYTSCPSVESCARRLEVVPVS
jgi:hypothetical protein